MFFEQIIPVPCPFRAGSHRLASRLNWGCEPAHVTVGAGSEGGLSCFVGRFGSILLFRCGKGKADGGVRFCFPEKRVPVSREK